MFQSYQSVLREATQEIDTLMKEPTRENIDKFRKRYDETLQFVSKFRHRYCELIKKSYEIKPPFGSNDKEKDFQDFIVLVSYAMELDDEQFLYDWAVEYPHKNPKKLAQPLLTYCEKIEQQIIKDWPNFNKRLEIAGKPRWPEDLLPYWEILVEELSRILHRNK